MASIAAPSSILARAVAAVGGPVSAAKHCGVSRQAVDKWVARGALPRSDYTGETAYAATLAAHSGGSFTAEMILDASSPARAARVIPGNPAGDRRKPLAAHEPAGRRATDLSADQALQVVDTAEQLAEVLRPLAEGVTPQSHDSNSAPVGAPRDEEC